MKLENVLQYVTHHSEAITQWLFLTILLLSGALVARGLFSKKSEDGEAPAMALGAATAAAGMGSVVATAPSPELQAALTKIMEQTAKLESISLGELNPAGLQQVNTQVEALKRDLQAKESEIAQLKANGDAKPTAEAGDLSSRIKELEAKLAEYEILEDDIADLSLYKEENTRLRAEIEKFRGGDGAVAPAAAPPAPGPVSAAAAPVQAAVSPEPQRDPSALAEAVVATSTSDDIVAEFAQAVGQEAVPSGDPALADVEIPDTGNPMADFENTVKLEKQIKPSTPAPAPVAAAPSAPGASTSDEKDDLFAEFSQSKPQESDELNANLDTDKMMAEMAALVGHEPSGNALEEDVDTDKMVLEMSGFNSKS